MAPTALGFLYGGIIATLAASILEPLFIQKLTFGSAFLVSLIEEFVKVAGIFLIFRHSKHNSEMDGIILGAASGMGFAAFESAGYAFAAFLQSGGSISFTVFTSLTRAITSPIGHGTWTAIVMAAIFRESTSKRFRIDLQVIGAFLFAVLMHGLWDGLPGVIDPSAPYYYSIIVVLGLGALSLYVLRTRWKAAKKRAIEECPPKAGKDQ